MEIAPNFTEHQWKVLTFRGKQDWVVGIAALRRRLEQRFIKLAHALLRFKKSGFAILALDCLLVETLSSSERALGRRHTLNAAAVDFWRQKTTSWRS